MFIAIGISRCGDLDDKTVPLWYYWCDKSEVEEITPVFLYSMEVGAHIINFAALAEITREDNSFRLAEVLEAHLAGYSNPRVQPLSLQLQQRMKICDVFWWRLQDIGTLQTDLLRHWPYSSTLPSQQMRSELRQVVSLVTSLCTSFLTSS